MNMESTTTWVTRSGEPIREQSEEEVLILTGLEYVKWVKSHDSRLDWPMFTTMLNKQLAKLRSDGR